MDFTALSTALVTEVGDVLTAAMPILTLIISATVGYKLFRKFVG